MPIIIDGWNLVRDAHSPIDDDEGDSLDSARSLIICIENYQRSHRDPIVLVFDSTNEYLGLRHINSPVLKVIPAADADDYIKKYVERTPEKQRRNLRVVSSDSDVYYYARSSGATPVRSREFWAKLNRYRD